MRGGCSRKGFIKAGSSPHFRKIAPHPNPLPAGERVQRSRYHGVFSLGDFAMRRHLLALSLLAALAGCSSHDNAGTAQAPAPAPVYGTT